jgi:uncharacterized membrane protein YdbT with pleckstrin-like domain
MYCIKCGSDNLETAAYCRKCGAAIEEEETRVALRPSAIAAKIGGDADTDATEAEIFVISPTLMFVKVGYVLAALGALLLVAIFSAFITSVSAWVAVLIGMLLFLIPAFFHFKQKMVRYTLTDSKLEIDEGFISRTTRSVPIRRIQDVTVSSGVMQRLLGFGDLMIDNASDEGGKVILRNINTPRHYADVLLRQMRRLDG